MSELWPFVCSQWAMSNQTNLMMCYNHLVHPAVQGPLSVWVGSATTFQPHKWSYQVFEPLCRVKLRLILKPLWK